MLLLLNKTSESKETRAALLENDKLIEVYLGEEEEESIAGSIYLGKIEKFIPALEAAFVKLPNGENAFLRMRDIKQDYLDSFSIKKLQEGQKVLVQIKKESVGTKGPQITTNIGIAGRYVVLLPFSKSVGISRKILSEEDRERLKKIGRLLKEKYSTGLIIRTAAAEISEEFIYNEMENLYGKWKEIVNNFKKARKPKLLYKESDSDEFIIREFLRPEVTEVVTNDENHREIIRRFHQKATIKVISGDVFENFEIDEKLREVLKRKMTLPSGGEIVIDKAEAMTVIDVNSSHYIATESHEQLSEEINLEAAREICRILRLRNIGGIVIIDFIDMKDEKSKEQILKTVKSEILRDRNRVEIYGFTHLGLLEMARKRTSKSLDEKFIYVCPTCEGKGRVLNPKIVLERLKKEVEKKPNGAKEVIIKMHPEFKNFVEKEELKKFFKVEVHIHYTHVDPNTYEISWKI
ncbi:MAG TPA: Rne/Rng family ribonuclease [Fervidobacterium sp.]|nr:Rne/Rng family ribonuclease [Fervidobacterium sp.]